MRFSILTVLLLVAAAPRPKPAPVEDGSGPRAALLMYDKLVGPNEADKALPLYHATTTRERALARALAKCDGALANLRKQATAKFGSDVAEAMLQSVDATTATDINAAQIRVVGDTAYVTFPGAARPTTMVRVDGEWKLSVKAMAQDVKSNLRDFRKALGRLATTANQMADKIQQGQFAASGEPSKQLLEAYKQIFSSAAATKE
jgi:hypothetical protein